MVIETEIWRTVVINGEIYDKYKISNLGRLIDLNYRRTGKAKLMEPFDNGHGYLQVHLSKNKITKTFLVHRLVSEIFIPNPNNLTEVNHIDEDKTNNRVNNLEWKSHRDNCNHGTRNKRMAKTKSKKVLQFTLSGEFIREWESTRECGRNGFNHGNIVSCCNGKLPHYKGYKWCYA